MVPDAADVLARLQLALAGRYAVERELGRGGMATVYLATDQKHDRPVAMKVLHPELAVVLGAERFLREIKLTARLNHPHILPLLDSGEADGFLFYVMPYVEGESLRERLVREKQLPIDDALQISREVADALSYAQVAALTVISRTSVMEYAAHTKPLRQIARELGVGSVVEGSVQIEGGRLRVNVQLIDAATDAHLWAERYDRTLEDAFAVQSDVAQQIVAAVGAMLSSAERQGLAAAPTANAEAYRLYLQRREYLTRPGRCGWTRAGTRSATTRDSGRC
jgi:TolB-like protein